MGDTTLTVDEDVRERLSNYRHDDHYSVTDVLESMMAVLPTYEQLREGCAQCGDPPFEDAPIDESHGVIWYWQLPEEHGGGLHMNWFCSRECMGEFIDEIDKQVPREPDLVRVGGHKTPAVEVTTDLSLHLGMDTREVGIGLPGVFASTELGFDYEGEPVYVKNQGEWVQHGVAEEFIHEEAHTAILLSEDLDVVMENHPSDRKRERWEQERQQDEGSGE